MIEELGDAQPLIVLALLCSALLLESLRPLVEFRWPRFTHGRRNLGIGLLAFAAFGAMGAVKLAAVAWAEHAGVGLLRALPLGAAARLVIGVLLIDFTDYFFHRAQHAVGWIWRFHRVHHSDAGLDATSALRFHPVEGALGVAWQAPVAVLLGIGLDAVVVLDTLLLVALYAQHANVAWPAPLERALRPLLATPSVHRVHHSRDPRQTDSNFGDVFSLWDRLCGTYREAADLRALPYGLEGFDGERHQTVLGMLRMPLALGDAPAEPRPRAA